MTDQSLSQGEGDAAYPVWCGHGQDAPVAQPRCAGHFSGCQRQRWHRLGSYWLLTGLLLSFLPALALEKGALNGSETNADSISAPTTEQTASPNTDENPARTAASARAPKSQPDPSTAPVSAKTAVSDVATEAAHILTPARPTLPKTLNTDDWGINFPGGLALVPLTPEQARATAYFNGRRVLLAHSGDVAVALIGLGAKTNTGEHQLTIELSDQQTLKLPFQVRGRHYPTVNFEYPRKYRSYDEPTLARIQREKRVIGLLKKTHSDLTPDLDFAWPSHGRISSRFGNRRVFLNNTSIHSGLDIANVTGTDVKATAGGIVLAATDYYFTGNTVIIDHGSGVLSLYSHLNDFTVQDGQEVAKGDLVGHIGNTGRSTGPHLHFSIGFNGQWIDPLIVLPAHQPTKTPQATKQ